MGKFLMLVAALALVACGGGGSSAGGGGSSGGSSGSSGGGSSGGGAGYSLTFSSLLDGASGSGYEMVRDIAIDAQGNIYLTGGTTAPDFPTTAGVYQRTFATGGTAVGNQGPGDVFVTKMSPTGQIVWSTFLGGPNYDRAYAIRVGSDGSVYVAGRAGPGFPTTSGVAQQVFAGDNSPNTEYGQQDGFVAKLSSDGKNLLWSTYVGDAGHAFLRDMDVDAQGRVYLAAVNVGQSMGSFITSNGWRKALSGDGNDGAYIRLSADASHAEYGTYFGASGSSSTSTGSASVRLAPDGSVVVSSVESGQDFPTVNAYQAANAGGNDFILMKFSPSDQIAFATYLGGSGNEANETHHLAIDNAGKIYLTGATASSNFPTTAGVVQRQYGGAQDTLVAVLSASGQSLLASTFLGGSGNEMTQGINVAHVSGAADAVILSGTTTSSSASLPASTGATSGSGGAEDAYLAVLSADLTTLRYLRRMGGSGDDDGRANAISSDGSKIYFGGHTLSSGFPTTTAAGQIKGTYAAWVAALTAN